MTILEAQKIYPVLSFYSDKNHEAYIPYETWAGEPTPEYTGDYRIVFDVGENRFYCTIEAPSLNEALGIFFRHHPCFNYQMIVAHEAV